MYKIILFLVTIFSISFLVNPVFANQKDNTETIEILFFYSPTCKHCEKMRGELNRLKQKNPIITIKDYDVYTNPENQKIFSQLGSIYEQTIQSVPVVIINDKVLIGDSKSNVNALENEIQYCSTEKCVKPSETIADWQKENKSTTNPKQQKIIYLLIGIGVVITFILIILFTKERKNKTLNNGSNN